MEEENNNSYITAFNQGFRLRQFSPDLYELLKPSLQPDNEYHAAILAGAEECEREQENAQLKELESIRKNKEQSPDMER